MSRFIFFMINILIKIKFIKRPLSTNLEYNLSFDFLPQAYYKNNIYSSQKGNDQITKILESGNPCMICRFGSTELSVIYNFFLRYGKFRQLSWSDEIKKEINKSSGFFPPTDSMISRYAKESIKFLSEIDLLGVWYKPGEDIIVNKYMPNVFLSPLNSIEPYYFEQPWSSALSGKKVLVIHPFAESIKDQYEKNRKKLFKNEVLPNFNLEVIEAVQSLGTSKTTFDTWFHAFEFMCEKIKDKDFDVAIIGAGAYGMPLAAFVKKMGKQAIHMGGATQILFGIKGKRWDKMPDVSKFYNEFWVRPLEKETPAIENQLEEGCYW